MSKQETKNSNTRLLLRIFSFVKPFTGLLLLTILLNFIFSTLSTISVAIIKPIFQVLFSTDIDTSPAAANPLEGLKNGFYSSLKSLVSVHGNQYATLINLCIFIIVIFILKNSFKYIGSVTAAKFEEGIIKSIRDKVFSKLTSLSVDFFTKSRSGNLISIITNDVTVVNSTTISSFTTMLRESTQIILFLFLLFTISVKLTLIAFSTSIISLILIRKAMTYLRRYASRMQNAMADYTSALQETISGVRVVKAYNAEETANKRFFGDTMNYVRSAIKHKKIISLIPSLNEVFAIFALCIVLLVGGSQVLSTEMPADDLMLFLFSLFSIMSPISTVVNSISQFQHGIVASERVFGVLDSVPTVKDGTETLSGMKASIYVENVSFAYNSETVIHDVSLSIEKGRKIAFVGPSGGGKSTMLDLIIRFYDPVEGNISIDGKNIRNIKLDSYRRLFGVVSQETMLFNDSVANNIRYGMENTSFDEIVEASKISNAYNFIIKLPEGFDTIVGDRGVMLSGGERQRIAIARALVRNPQILAFDEATSALDSESEKIVQEAINSSLKNRTAIIVAHRLATIIDCDEIFVFSTGRITERGSHSQLLAKNGIYKNLYDIQFAQQAIDSENEHRI